VAAGGKKIREMTDDERRAYHRAASKRSRVKHAGRYEREKAERLAAETPEQTESRKAAQREQSRRWHASLTEEQKQQRREALSLRRKTDPDFQRRSNEAAKRYRDANIDARRARERELWKIHYPKYKERIVENNRKRKALLRGASVGEVVFLSVVAQRDHWRCHICGKKVTRENWSMDHLIPLSQGGPHSYANVGLAHGVCNKRRHVGKYMDTQLRIL
jgi:5-methylcytosine-specific restriction endonuclease McrA